MPGKPTILCVDDKEENLRIRTLLLQQFGCRIASEEPVDLVLLDYHLANGETGEQVARDMRVLKPRVPLIMLTGDVNLPDTARHCVDAVITKGISSPTELFDIIQQLLPGSELHPRRPMLIPEPPRKR